MFFILFTYFYSANAASDLVITEIAASPGTDHEWVEIYNRGSMAHNLAEWKFWEQGANHGVKYFSGSEMLAPQSFAIITQDATTFLADYPGFQGSVFDSSWGSLKETGEEIGLRDKNGLLSEVFTFQSAQAQFLQKKDPLLDDYSATNWLEAEATPGALFEQAVTDKNNVVEESFELVVDNSVHPPETEEIYAVTSTPATEPVVFEPVVTEPIIARTAPVPPGYSWGVVWINEIVSDPIKGESEWIELKSNSVNTIDLAGWQVVDDNKIKTILSGTLPAFGYFVVEKPKGNLNNSGDKIILFDPQGNSIDAVPYGNFGAELFNVNNPAAPSKGLSLARVSELSASNNPFADFALTGVITKGGKNVVHINQVVEQGPTKERGLVETTQVTSTIADAAPKTAVKAKKTSTIALNQNLCVTSTLQIEAAAAPEDSIISIEDAKEKSLGTKVRVRGAVTTMPQSISPYYFYIEENGHGIQVYNYHKQFPKLLLGSEMVVYGEISSAYGMPRIKIKNADDIVVEKNNLHTEPASIEDIVEDMVGTFVIFEGEVVEKNARQFVVSTAVAEITVKMPKEKIQELKVGAFARVSGIGVSYKGEVYVVPRGAQDIEIFVRENQEVVATSTAEFAANEIVQENRTSSTTQSSGKDNYALVTLGGLAGGGAGAYLLRKALAMLVK